MSHVPKRAVGHSLFLPESERQVIELPEKQTSAYTESAVKPLLTTLQQSYNLSDYRSNYGQTVSADYHPSPSFKPRNSLTSGSAEFPDFRPAKLWRSEYQAASHQIAGSQPPAPSGHGRHAPRKTPVVSVDLGVSTSAETFADPACLAKHKKPVSFMPGYQGFVPSNMHNPYVEAYARGERREDRDRSNITENFQRVLPGYTGYLPVNGSNDRNPRQATTMTETGRVFAVHNNWTLI